MKKKGCFIRGQIEFKLALFEVFVRIGEIVLLSIAVHALADAVRLCMILIMTLK